MMKQSCPSDIRLYHGDRTTKLNHLRLSEDTERKTPNLKDNNKLVDYRISLGRT